MSGDFKWRLFVGEIILWAVRWYGNYGVSYRDLEEMMESAWRRSGSHHAVSLGSTLYP
jgi:transposase, IS6 family